MDRSTSRSRRYYYYDNTNNNDYASRSPKHPRHNHHHHRRTSNKPPPPPQEGQMVTTTYRILCHEARAGAAVGKALKNVRQATGAWVTVQELVPGDDECVIEISDTSPGHGLACRSLCRGTRSGLSRFPIPAVVKNARQVTGAWISVQELVPEDEEQVIEISDTRRRDPEGRMPSFSPAQEALFLIHERILECEAAYGGWGSEEEGGNRAVTRMVVSRMHVGSLLGKGGKIIEQMRMETKTHIRVLPRDHTLPRCVAMSEEIVQVVGDMNAVKSAIAIISSRLRESQHRDRSNTQAHGRDGANFHGRVHSPERVFPPEDEFIPQINNTPRRLPGGLPGGGYDNYPSRSSGFGNESIGAPMTNNGPPISGDDIVFRILCPIDKVESVVGENDGFLELLQQEVGVDVKVVDRVTGSNEQIVIISSNEGPDDDLFPAQEALLHIQTRIVDLFPEKDNVITTRLLIPSGEVGCLEGKDGSLSELKRLTGASIQILPREELPACIAGTDELVQIVGEIKAAREAVVEVTSRLRSFIYQEFFQRDTSTPFFPAPSPGPSVLGREELHQFVQPAKDFGGSVVETVKQPEKERRDDMRIALNKISMPLVTRSILEVVLPDHAVSKLSKNKLSQISELSGAGVKLVEDGPQATEKVIQISGTPEQAERAQSLLQGFILSTQD